VQSVSALELLTALRKFRGDGKRALRKPIRVLLALGQSASSGSSSLSWFAMERRPGQLLAEFGTSSRNGASSAVYPSTRLRSDACGCCLEVCRTTESADPLT